MRHRERGVTFLGWVFLLAPVGLVLYAGIRLTPVYLEYMKIARTLEQVRDESQGEKREARMLRTAIERRFDIEGVTVIDRNDVTITKDGSGYVVEATYSDNAPLFGNVSLNVDFSKVVQIE
jgi:Domain of unknown function (DUF4845)